jgi:hypothetical protein
VLEAGDLPESSISIIPLMPSCIEEIGLVELPMSLHCCTFLISDSRALRTEFAHLLGEVRAPGEMSSKRSGTSSAPLLLFD